MPDQKYLVAIKINSSKRGIKELKVNRKLKPLEIDILYLLCESFGKLIPLNRLSERLQTSVNAINIRLTRVRRVLHPDWAVEVVFNKGARITYTGPEDEEEEKIELEVIYDSISLDSRKESSVRKQLWM